MNRLKNLLLLVLFVTVVSSCENKTDKELEELNKVLMEGHDTVMPKSMTIGNLKKDLIGTTETASDSVKSEVAALSDRLQKAEDDMYTWMEDYGKALNDIEDKEEKLKLYKSLKEDIERIRKETDESIEKARKIIESDGKP